MTFRESDGRIVPLKSGHKPDGTKPSNIGAGKAVLPAGAPGQDLTRFGSSIVRTQRRNFDDKSDGPHYDEHGSSRAESVLQGRFCRPFGTQADCEAFTTDLRPWLIPFVPLGLSRLCFWPSFGCGGKYQTSGVMMRVSSVEVLFCVRPALGGENLSSQGYEGL